MVLSRSEELSNVDFNALCGMGVWLDYCVDCKAVKASYDGKVCFVNGIYL